MLATAIGRLRLIGIIEGASYVALLFIAMPLKYLADMPQAVRVVGAVHGLLFVLFCFALLQVFVTRRLTFLQSDGTFIASLVPFGTWLIDSRLKKVEASPTTAATTTTASSG